MRRGEAERETLIAAARQAARMAYAPYSRFRVGAAVAVEIDGETHIVPGANIENASYGLTLCAERSALAQACLLGEGSRPEGPGAPVRVIAVGVACIDVPEDAPDWQRMPCGACRQWLAELAPDAVYYIDGVERDLHLPDLLPYAFRLGEGRTSPPIPSP